MWAAHSQSRRRPVTLHAHMHARRNNSEQSPLTKNPLVVKCRYIKVHLRPLAVVMGSGGEPFPSPKQQQRRHASPQEAPPMWQLWTAANVRVPFQAARAATPLPPLHHKASACAALQHTANAAQPEHYAAQPEHYAHGQAASGRARIPPGMACLW